MPTSPEEMRLRDVAIGLQVELTQANYQREKVEFENAELRNQIQDIDNRLRAEINAIRQSRTWRIGSLVLAPVHWMKRCKR
jgi:hypothetical protein